jgi:hypothetical protein
MITLIICVISTIAIFPTISPFGIDGNMFFIAPPLTSRTKDLNCSFQAPPDLVHSTVIPEKDISADLYVFSLAATLLSSVARLLVKRSYGPALF